MKNKSELHPIFEFLKEKTQGTEKVICFMTLDKKMIFEIILDLTLPTQLSPVGSMPILNKIDIGVVSCAKRLRCLRQNFHFNYHESIIRCDGYIKFISPLTEEVETADMWQQEYRPEDIVSNSEIKRKLDGLMDGLKNTERCGYLISESKNLILID